MLNSSLVSIAAQLLNSRKLRLYQDCVFLKHPGFSETHWHSDCPLSPLDTSAFVTAWIPLRHIKACSALLYMKNALLYPAGHSTSEQLSTDQFRRSHSGALQEGYAWPAHAAL